MTVWKKGYKDEQKQIQALSTLWRAGEHSVFTASGKSLGGSPRPSGKQAFLLELVKTSAESSGSTRIFSGNLLKWEKPNDSLHLPKSSLEEMLKDLV